MGTAWRVSSARIAKPSPFRYIKLRLIGVATMIGKYKLRQLLRAVLYNFVQLCPERTSEALQCTASAQSVGKQG